MFLYVSEHMYGGMHDNDILNILSGMSQQAYLKASFTLLIPHIGGHKQPGGQK